MPNIKNPSHTRSNQCNHGQQSNNKKVPNGVPVKDSRISTVRFWSFLASARPNDPPLPTEPASEADRVCVSADVGPKGEADEEDIRLRFCLDDLRRSPGRGADIGDGKAVKPTVFISSGWKSPRRTEFFIYRGRVRNRGNEIIKFSITLKPATFSCNCCSSSSARSE